MLHHYEEFLAAESVGDAERVVVDCIADYEQLERSGGSRTPQDAKVSAAEAMTAPVKLFPSF